MLRRTILFAALIVLPALGVGGYAIRSVDRAHGESVERLRNRTEARARSLARELERALARARAEALARIEPVEVELTQTGRLHPAGFDQAVRVVGPGGRIRYGPVTDPATRALDQDRVLYERSLRGGRRFEFGRKDPARAMDAYGFYLPEIRSEALRARLVLATARAARAAGRTGLAGALWHSLLEKPASWVSEEGLPLWLVSLIQLRSAAPPAVTRERCVTLLGDRLSTLDPVVAGFVLESLAIRDRGVEEQLASQAAVDADVYTALRTGRSTCFVRRDALVVVRPVRTLPGGWRLACRVPLTLPAGFDDPAVRLEPVGLSAPAGVETPWAAKSAKSTKSARSARSPGPSGPSGTFAARVPIVGPGGSAPLARLVVENPDHAREVAALNAARTGQRLLIGLLLAATVAGSLVAVLGFQRARRLARLRRDLLANVTHELKTPLTSIRMFAEMLARDPLDEERTRRFGRLLTAEAARLTGLVENALDSARDASGPAREPDLCLEPVDVASRLAPLAEVFSLRAEQEGVSFSFSPDAMDPESGVPLRARADGPALDRIVLNLLENALRYRRAAPGGSRIALEIGVEGEHVAVTVEDNGPGIPEAERERIFAPFHRVGYHDYGVRGAGLGLALARRLARAQSGDVRVRSRVGEGSRFTLVLPRARPDAGAKAGAEESGSS